MTENEYLMNRLYMLNRNSIYGLLTGDSVDHDRLNCPKPPIYIGPVKIKTLKERLEETRMKATSTQVIKNVRDMCFSFENLPFEMENKLTVVAYTNDDVFAFEFEGQDLFRSCKRSGLFTGWEKEQMLKEKDREIIKLKEKLQQVKDNKKNLKEEYEAELDALKRKYNLEKAANEAQHKFFVGYAGKGTEIEFNYAIDDAEEVSYVIVDKKYLRGIKDDNRRFRENNNELRKEIGKLKDTAGEGDYVMVDGDGYGSLDIKRLKDRINELEKELHSFKLEKRSNTQSEEPSSRRDILHAAEKCVCGHREQDYGSPESNFQLIADLWNQYLFKEPGAKEVFGIGPMDVSMMMALMKIARIRNGGGSGDSFVDLAGYAACGGEIWHLNKETNTDSN